MLVEPFFPIVQNDTQSIYIIFVNDKIWGYTSTEDEAYNTITKIASSLLNKLLKEQSNSNLELINCGPTQKIIQKTLKFYLFNWTTDVYKIKCEAIPNFEWSLPQLDIENELDQEIEPKGSNLYQKFMELKINSAKRSLN